MTGSLVTGEDGAARCWWGAGEGDYAAYHDQEWGRPVADDQRLFEKICLEGFQSGLSWLTILRKRPGFRAAFHDFDFERVAVMGEPDVLVLLQDTSIVRHRGKIEATLNNARAALATVEAFGSLSAYFWRFEPPSGPPSLQATTPASVALAKDLKARGWRFVGPTTAYAFMQAMGLVNDHVDGCHVRADCLKARSAFSVPLPRQA